MTRFLIINADDFNLTPGVNRAILECHDEGIVTSTTFMVNLPLNSATIRALRKRKKLGVGLHLNVTLGKPVSSSQSVLPLLHDAKSLHKGLLGAKKRLSRSQKQAVVTEYTAQLRKFRKVFGRLPTHLDTHHQVHDREDFLEILLQMAKKNRLPIRRSRLFPRKKNNLRGVCSTDRLLGDLRVNGYWRRTEIERGLRSLPEGVSEVMAHPGYVDGDLKKISGFTTGRYHEWRLFRSEQLRRSLKNKGIKLTHYGICYNR